MHVGGLTCMGTSHSWAGYGYSGGGDQRLLSLLAWIGIRARGGERVCMSLRVFDGGLWAQLLPDKHRVALLRHLNRFFERVTSTREKD